MASRLEERRWQRFERDGGPSRIDRLTLSHPLLLGIAMAVVIGALYVLIGRAMFDTAIDQDRLVDALMYGVIFTAVWLTMQRRTLAEAVRRWDDQTAAGRQPDPLDSETD